MKKVNILTKTKAQITIFMILGIILLLTFILLYFISDIAKKPAGKERVEETFENALASQSIKQYVTSCLENALQDGLIILGNQGGFLFIDQGSIIPRTLVKTAQLNQENITYLIRPVPLQPPWYPCFTPENPPGYCNFTNNLTRFPKLYSYSFGTSKLPFLTKKQGAFSIQAQLEQYVSSYTKRCINIQSLIALPELAGYNISEGNISANVSFGANDVSAIIDYPVSISSGNKKISKVISYGAKINIRFLKIYESVNDMIQKDNNYLEYALVEDTLLGFFLGNPLKFRELYGATITKIQIPNNTYDNIIIINDSLSKIKGEPYAFKFAIQNRIPVLDYIEKKILDENSQLTIYPKASDPDEDPVSITYTGWRAESFPSLIVTSSDIGYHLTTVHASDAQLEDYQDVEILVCSLNNIGRDGKCDAECGADSKCNSIAIGGLIGECTNVGKDYLEDKCNENCQLIDYSKCTATCGAHPNCNEKEPYSLVLGQGWCYGNSGCTNFCTSEIVSKDIILSSDDTCGCASGIYGYKCDSNFDRIFEGRCDDEDGNGIMECVLQQ